MSLLSADVRPCPDHNKHEPLDAHEIDALPDPIRGRVWATIVDLRKQVNRRVTRDYPDAHEPGI